MCKKGLGFLTSKSLKSTFIIIWLKKAEISKSPKIDPIYVEKIDFTNTFFISNYI